MDPRSRDVGGAGACAVPFFRPTFLSWWCPGGRPDLIHRCPGGLSSRLWPSSCPDWYPTCSGWCPNCPGWSRGRGPGVPACVQAVSRLVSRRLPGGVRPQGSTLAREYSSHGLKACALRRTNMLSHSLARCMGARMMCMGVLRSSLDPSSSSPDRAPPLPQQPYHPSGGRVVT